jgi:hypothetical protein
MGLSTHQLRIYFFGRASKFGNANMRFIGHRRLLGTERAHPGLTGWRSVPQVYIFSWIN